MAISNRWLADRAETRRYDRWDRLCGALAASLLASLIAGAMMAAFYALLGRPLTAPLVFAPLFFLVFSGLVAFFPILWRPYAEIVSVWAGRGLPGTDPKPLPRPSRAQRRRAARTRR